MAVFHAVDYAAYPKKPGNMPRSWGKESRPFLTVDIMAHHMKHVRSDEEKRPPTAGISYAGSLFSFGQFNTAQLNTVRFGSSGVNLHNLYFDVRDALTFVRSKAPPTT